MNGKRRTSIPVNFGEINLEAEYFLPDREDPLTTAVILCHPHPEMGGTMINSVIAAIFAEFVTNNVPVLRFNFRGVGESSRTYDQGIGEVNDTKEVIGAFIEIAQCPEIFVAGYSFGAAVGGAAAAEVSEVVGYAAVAMPFRLIFEHAERMNCPKPKLFVTATRDTFTPLAEFYSIMKPMTPPIEISEVKGTDHFFTNHTQEVGTTVVNYFLEKIAKNQVF